MNLHLTAYRSVLLFEATPLQIMKRLIAKQLSTSGSTRESNMQKYPLHLCILGRKPYKSKGSCTYQLAMQNMHDYTEVYDMLPINFIWHSFI